MQLSCFFYYGKEDLDVIGLSFRKDIWMQHIQIHPPVTEDKPVNTHMQDVLMEKAGEGGYPFTFNVCSSVQCCAHQESFTVLSFNCPDIMISVFLAA